MDHRTFFETVLHIHDACLLDALLPITSSLHLKKGQVLIKE